MPSRSTYKLRAGFAEKQSANPLECPECKSEFIITTDSRLSSEGRRRRRQCEECSRRFTTVEIKRSDYLTLLCAQRELEKLKQTISEEYKLCPTK